jgi:hypothetical protein
LARNKILAEARNEPAKMTPLCTRISEVTFLDLLESDDDLDNQHGYFDHQLNQSDQLSFPHVDLPSSRV